jgi:RNA polymerase sigma-70 factor (ECF subfamily)
VQLSVRPEEQRDQDIVDRLRRGDASAAFEELALRYEKKVYRLCCSLLRDLSLAEDAAQESMLRIWKSLAGYDERASLSTWIYAITRNRCLTALERQRTRRAGEALAAAEAALACQTAETRDKDSLVRDLVERLPDRYRQSILLFYYEDKSIAETRDMLGLPEGTVKTNLSRGRALLLEQMAQLGLSDVTLWLGSNPS